MIKTQVTMMMTQVTTITIITIITIIMVITQVTGQGESGKVQAEQLVIMTSVLLPFLARQR